MSEERRLLNRVLKESFFFKGLSEELINELENLAVIKTYKKNQEIFSEGERALGFFLLLEGHVKIYKLSPKGKEQIIHLLGPGDVFAEVVLSGIETYPAYAQAVTSVKVAFFSKNHFLKLVQRRPEFALTLIALFAGKLRSLVKTIENLTLKEAGERFLHYLWELSNEGKTNPIKLPVSKTQIALLLGVTPETLSRLLKRYQEEGLLFLKGKAIEIRSPEKWRLLLS